MWLMNDTHRQPLWGLLVELCIQQASSQALAILKHFKGAMLQSHPGGWEEGDRHRDTHFADTLS